MFQWTLLMVLGSPRPVSSAPGGRTIPSAASQTPRWHRAALAQAAAVLPALCRWGGRRCGLCPAREELQRPSAPARRHHLPASRRYRLPPVSEEPEPARPSGAAGAGDGVLRAAAALGGRWGGAQRPPPRPEPCGGAVSPQPRCPVPSGGAAHEVKMVIRVFIASSSGSVAIKKRQQDVVRFLEANRIEFEEVDITMSEEKRQWMYKNIPEDRQPAQGNPLPPQIFSDDRYCGDYDGFFESKESNTVFSFLGLKPTLASKESEP
ncbi:SH3 domain-binding glutamic acid-rich-like protein 2 [Melopsittacus undulatus]|nr:SH3 domain-binding glutamic acid-rich-like protein 2 [Melopsittacus undulatus]